MELKVPPLPLPSCQLDVLRLRPRHVNSKLVVLAQDRRRGRGYDGQVKIHTYHNRDDVCSMKK